MRFGSLITLLMALVCGAAIGVTGSGVRDLSTELREHGRPNGKYQAFVVFQSADCDARLDFLTIFRRPKLASFSVTGLFVGTREEEEEARDFLSARQPHTSVRRIDRGTARALQSIGYRLTPFLILVDADQRVRLAAPLPRTDDEYMQLVTLLEALSAQ